jgi:hypothetical protein
VTLPSAADCAAEYASASGHGAVVMLDPRAATAAGDVAQARTVDALTTLRWISRPVTVAPRLLALEAGGAAALVLHHGVDPQTGQVHVGRVSDDDPPVAEQLAALGLPPAGTSGDDDATVDQDALASVLAFAVLAESEAPGQEPDRPPAPDPDDLPLDIYASEFIGLATDLGAPLESIWHQTWELSGVRWCLLNADLDVEDVDRIPYRQVLPAADFIRALRACTEAGLHFLDLPVCVTTGPGSGHVIHIETIDDSEVVYHDPWPGRSLLAPGNNAFGIGARPWEGPARRWCVTVDELQRVAYASLVEPAVWLPLCGVATDVRYADLQASEFFGFFHLSETGRTTDEQTGMTTIGLQPGAWQEHIELGAVVDGDEAIRMATLMLDRSWVSDPQTAMFAADLISHFIGAVVTQADAGEAELLCAALRVLPTGGVVEALSAGAPHVLTQFRLIAMTVADAAPFARATLPCSTVRVMNGTANDDTDRSRLLVGVTRPRDEPGALVEDQRSGYLMDDARAWLWGKAQRELERINANAGGA